MRGLRLLVVLLGLVFVVSVIHDVDNFLDYAVYLTAYSVSGLVGIGHYMVAGATDMVWRQAHVIVGNTLGILVLAFALWSVATRRTGAAR